MTLILRKLNNLYDYLVYDLADPRTKDYFLVENPFHVFAVMAVYVYLVKKLGPAIMQNKKAFELRQIMIAYNIFQIAFNFYLFAENFWYFYGPTGSYQILCQTIDRSYSPLAYRAIEISYGYFLLKIADLLDTIFMVLRKKNNHISFLHVYHHAGMIALSWGAIKYLPGGHFLFVGLFNTFVHTVMYCYYLYTILNPSQQRNSLWWKKYLTLTQIVQFVCIGFHQSLPVLIPSCNHPKIGFIAVTPQAIFMLFLFRDFYRKAYLNTKSNSPTSSIENDIKKKN